MIRVSLFLISIITLLTSPAYADPKVATQLQPISVTDGIDMETIDFSRIVVRIPDTKTIGEIQEWRACFNVGEFTLSGNNFTPSDIFFKDKFVEELSTANYNVIGDQVSLFNDTNAAQGRFQVAGVLDDMEADVCYYDGVKPMPMLNRKRIKGAVYMSIEWQVFDAVSRTVVYTVRTEGYHEIKKAVDKGYQLMIENAYGSAIRNLLAQQEFYNLLLKNDEATLDPTFDNILVNYGTASESADAIELAQATQSVVTIKAGGGHGSGFIISQDGYILTNQHVVGGDETVLITFDNGMEIEGQVIRRASVRDVALVKVPLRRLKPLSLQIVEPEIGSDVYAIGSPLDTSFSGTVSQGIVSAYRLLDDQEYIQSDAQINGGNSGGPMVDQKGNVIAISVSGRVDGEGINFFIPIEFALKALNIENASSN